MKKSAKFVFLDVVYIILAILPIAFGIFLKIVTTPPSEGIAISGALAYFKIHLPIMDFVVSEAVVNSWLVILSIFWFILYMTHGTTVEGGSKRQHICEWIVTSCNNLVSSNMGEYFSSFAPFVASIMGLSAFSSLLTLVGLFPPTSDINIVGGWAILVFILITYYKMKCGPLNYLKSFTEPVPLLTPLNVISEVATPLSMAFRHYGNVLSGSVISVLVGSFLAYLSNLILGKLGSFIGQIPILKVGLPAVLSVYFDIFSGLLQAFIFAMLTMLYVSSAFPAELYFEKKKNKNIKKSNKSEEN